ncbi:MAG TPA: DUF4405 domain-containing protein [Phototrophicaceae bacterium]|nr:DUF4405 domain-containing protein [Phototrophicaceae bacterium]
MAVQLFSRKSVAQERPIVRKQINKTRWNVFLDLLLTATFIVELEEHFLGLALHELVGLFFGGAFILHIILHWDWIVNLTRTFFQKLLHESRFNYVLNILLFVAAALVTVTGILISRTLGLQLGLEQELQGTMKSLHMIGSELILVIVALHVALHWKWIKANAVKYLFGWLPKLGKRAVAANTAKVNS